jgi:hypothetical protein
MWTVQAAFLMLLLKQQNVTFKLLFGVAVASIHLAQEIIHDLNFVAGKCSL